MKRRSFVALLGGSVSLAGTGAAESGASAAPLREKLDAIRRGHQVPALAGARFGVNGLVRQVVTGVRKVMECTRVTEKDCWHFGSMTKAMTASLLATFVEQGRLCWHDVLGDLIPDACSSAHASVRAITVLELLQHRSGLPANLLSWWVLAGVDQREKILALAAPPDGKPIVPGVFLYSNIGYVIAGHIAEKLEGRLWEEVIAERILRPLKMTAGQGPAGAHQPWPHDSNGHPLPLAGPTADNPPSLGPAGRVHATLTDYALFAADHLRGAGGQPALLKSGSYQTLHRPDPGSHYACGWGIADRPWAGGRVLTHTGSNNANFSVVWLAPEKAFGVMAVCNQAGESAAKACDAVCAMMIRGD